MGNAVERVLVSVIVPAYNVCRYLEACVGSILNQSHKNIEVLIVDDGSTDGTEAIADKMEECDSRVRVFHKANAGVSAARNCGIEESKGDYLVFVDADDYIASDYIEHMLGLAYATGAEFCLSRVCFMAKDEKQTQVEVMTSMQPEEATALLLSPEVVVGCWNKIFKRSLIMNKNIRFSTELFYGEGLNFITTAAQLSNCVGVSNRKVYYYRRDNQSSATTKFNIEKFYNGEKALKRIKQNLAIDTPKINTMWNLHMSIFCLGAVTKVMANRMEKRYKADIKRWMLYIRKNAFTLVRSADVSLYRKGLLIAGAISPRLMMVLDNMRRRHIAKNSV